MAIKTIRVFQEFTSAGYVPMPVAGNIDYGVTIAGTFPGTTPTTFQTDDPDIDVTLTATTDYYVWIRSHGTDWNPMYTRNVRVYPDSPLINNVVMGIIIANLSGTVPYTGATTNVDLGTYGLKADYLQLNTSPTAIPATEGTFAWDSADGTANLRLKGGNINLQIGEDSVARVVNGTTANLLKADYKVVKIIGAQGQRLQIGLALADNDANSKDTIGLVAENINNNQEGFIMTSGLLDGINTTGSLQGETWNDGDTLYLSGTTPGKITNIKPQAPIHTIILGFVSYAHQNNGKIFVKVDNGYEIDELHNVKIVGALNKDVLVYNSTTKVWENRIIFKTQGYVPFYDDTLLLNNSPLYTNGNNVAIGSLTLTEKLVVGGNVLANQFKKVGGLSTEFLKADGSSDATAYQPLSADLTAIDNLALTTGLLRKNGSDTWLLDQTEYLSVPIAISTYQTLANLSSNLTASTTKYPSVNAVNAGLALKLNLSGGTLTGGLTLNYSYPNIALSDVSSGTTWNIQNDGSTFKLNYGATNNFYIFSSGNAAFVNSLTASSLIKSGGTSTQFLKADGSVDNTNYQPYDADLASIAGLELTTGLLRKNGLNTYTLDQTEYVALSTANSTYQILANLQSNLTASSTKYPSVNAVNTGLNLKLNLSGGTLSGDLAISSSIPTLQLSDTSSGTIWNIQNDGGGLEFNSGTTNKFVMYSSGNATFVNDLTANKFIKSGGTSSQFLMADGSTSSGPSGGITGTLTDTYIPLANGSNTLTNSNIRQYSNGMIGINSDASAWDSGWNGLQLSTGSYLSNRGEYMGITTGLYYNNGYRNSLPVSSTLLEFYAGNYIFSSASSAGTGSVVTLTPKMTLKLSGNLLINTTTDDGVNKLQVNGALIATSLKRSGGTSSQFLKGDGSVDSSAYLTGITSGMVISALGYTPYNSTNPNNYISGNQLITLSGDVSGSGTTAITTTLATITQGSSGSFVKITLDTKGRVTGNVAVGSSDITSALGYTPYNATNPSGYISGITSGMVTTALGYTPVTNARTLTINGTTYDLSADRSWTISGTIGGLTSGYIPKATSASTLGNSLIYDNGTNVGINTTSPTFKLETIVSAGVYNGAVSLQTDIGGGIGITGSTSGTNSRVGIFFRGNDTIGGAIAVARENPASDWRTYMAFYTNNSTGVNILSVQEKMRLSSDGNLLVGTTSSAGYLIQANGSIASTNSTVGQLLSVSGTRSIAIQSYSGDWNYLRSNGANFVLGTQDASNFYLRTNDVDRLTIASTGAATFSSSVTASGTLQVGNFYAYTTGLVNINAVAWLQFNGANTLLGEGTNTYLQANGGGSIIFRNNAPTELMRLNSSGNLGLGVTPSAWSAGKAFEISSNGNSVWSYGQDNIYLLANSYFNGGWKYGGIGYATNYTQYQGQHQWYTAPSGTAGNAISFTQAMTLDASGNLMVGTTTSGSKLHINGATSGIAIKTNHTAPYTFLYSYINNANGVGFDNLTGNLGVYVNGAYRMYLNTSGNVGIGTSSPARPLDVNGTMRIADGSSIEWGGVSAAISGTSASNALLFYTSSSERMRITSGGNLLIGTTTDSGYKLDVNGTGRFTSSVTATNAIFNQGNILLDYFISSTVYSEIRARYQGQNNCQSAIRFYNPQNGYSGDMRFYTQPNINLAALEERMRITDAGNVGIGTTSPTYKFVVSKGGAEGMEFDAGNIIAGRNYLINYNRSTSAYTDFQIDANNIMFGTLGSERMRITSGGQILMGTTSAQSGARLQVAGGFLDVWSSANTLLRLNHDGTRGVIETFTGGAYSPTSINPNGGNVLIGTTTDTGEKLQVNGNIRTNSGYVQIRNSSNPSLYLNNNTIQWQTFINSSNNLVFSDAISNVLTLAYSTGAATFSSSVSATGFFETSDKTIKTLITDNYLVKGIELITAKLYTKHGKEELGYFAQDVQGILPSAVTKGTNGLLNLSYREVLVAKVQSLEQRVKQLETQLNLG